MANTAGLMMGKIFNKIKFFWQKPKVIIVTASDNRETIKKFICQILGNSFSVNKEVLFVDNVEKANLSKVKYLILNFDDNSVSEIRKKISATKVRVLTFGFQPGADFQASDLKQNGHSYINFKINHKGSIVPFWLEKYSGQKQIYAALAAAAVGTIFELNLVEISQALTTVTK